MMTLASACSNKAQETAASADNTEAQEETAAPAEAAEATEAAEPVIVLGEGQSLDLAQGKPVIVDFNATWCGPCKQFAPTFDEVAKEYAGKALFYSVDVDIHPELAAEYGVTGIPHIQFINPADTTANTSMMGVQTKADFTKALDAFLK